MAAPVYNPQLQSSYQRLFDTCSIKADKYPEINNTVDKMIANRARYEAVGNALGIPWYFIGTVHAMEANGNFTKHLHNGDPLSARTVQVPAGRPKAGSPPITWEASAEDALVYQQMDQWKDWSIPGMLYKLEGYNGYGYRRPEIGIDSPYLWSYTDKYVKGKFVADGKYSAAAVSKQCGAAALLRRLAEKNLLKGGPAANGSSTPPVSDRIGLIKQLGALVSYAPSRYNAKGEELQRMLNLNGAHLNPDGKTGQMTSDAYKAVTGSYLSGDPRG